MSTAPNQSTTVAIASGYQRRELIRASLRALGNNLTEQIKRARRIFIHPNLVMHLKKAACTPGEAVAAVVDYVAPLAGGEILVGDAAYHGTKLALRRLGYGALAKSGAVKLVDLNDDKTIEAFAYTADLQKRPISFSKIVAESDLNIVVVPAKMHKYYTVSFSIKTHIVGSMVVPRSLLGLHERWPWLHTSYRAAHRTLAEVYAEHPAGLALIDGTQAMEGNGPTSGRRVDLGWLIASQNPVAADGLAAWLMGFRPDDIGYLHHLEAKGLGPIDPADMRIIGSDGKPLAADAVAGLRRELAKPNTYPAILDWR